MDVNVLYKPTNITGEPHPVGIYRGFFYDKHRWYNITTYVYIYIYILVGGLEDILFSILGRIIQFDFHIFKVVETTTN